MIIADSGFWLALGDKKDQHHLKANDFARTTTERFITTYPVITEVCHLLLKRQGIAAQLKFIGMYQLGAFDVFEIPKDEKKSDSTAYAAIRRLADGFCRCFASAVSRTLRAWPDFKHR